MQPRLDQKTMSIMINVQVLSVQSSLASRRREPDESKERLLALEKEQQKEEEEVQKRVAALSINVSQTTIHQRAVTERNLELNRKQSRHEVSDMPVNQYPSDMENQHRRLAFLMKNEAAISTKEKMLRPHNSLTGKVQRIVQDLGTGYERAKEKRNKVLDIKSEIREIRS